MKHDVGGSSHGAPIIGMGLLLCCVCGCQLPQEPYLAYEGSQRPLDQVAVLRGFLSAPDPSWGDRDLGHLYLATWIRIGDHEVHRLITRNYSDDVHLPPGPQTVVIRLRWANDFKEEVRLPFNAMAGHVYRLRYGERLIQRPKESIWTAIGEGAATGLAPLLGLGLPLELYESMTRKEPPPGHEARIWIESEDGQLLAEWWRQAHDGRPQTREGTGTGEASSHRLGDKPSSPDRIAK